MRTSSSLRTISWGARASIRGPTDDPIRDRTCAKTFPSLATCEETSISPKRRGRRCSSSPSSAVLCRRLEAALQQSHHRLLVFVQRGAAIVGFTLRTRRRKPARERAFFVGFDDEWMDVGLAADRRRVAEALSDGLHGFNDVALRFGGCLRDLIAPQLERARQRAYPRAEILRGELLAAALAQVFVDVAGVDVLHAA